jgi:hypothetical protein
MEENIKEIQALTTKVRIMFIYNIGNQGIG